MKLTHKENDFVISYRTNIKRANEQRERRNAANVFENFRTQTFSNLSDNPFNELLNAYGEISRNNPSNEVVNTNTISSDDSTISSEDGNGITVNLFGPETNENMIGVYPDDDYEDDIERETESIS